MRAINKTTGAEVKPGDEITDFRGEAWVFQYPTRETTEGKSGKVYVAQGAWKQELYANVFGLIVEAEKGPESKPVYAADGSRAY